MARMLARMYQLIVEMFSSAHDGVTKPLKLASKVFAEFIEKEGDAECKAARSLWRGYPHGMEEISSFDAAVPRC